MADLTDIAKRLQTVATWHNGRQKRFIQEIIADLTGTPAATTPPGPLAPPVGQTASTGLPGEGSATLPSGAPPAG